MDALVAAGVWVGRSTYRTAWVVTSSSASQCPHLNGKGPAVGAHTGQQCSSLLTSAWRAIAPLMTPWCAEGDVPTAANLNLSGAKVRT